VTTDKSYHTLHVLSVDVKVVTPITIQLKVVEMVEVEAMEPMYNSYSLEVERRKIFLLKRCRNLFMRRRSMIATMIVMRVR